MYDCEWWDSPDEHAFERGRNDYLWEEARPYCPEGRVACQHCGDEVPFVRGTGLKRLLLQPGTGRAWHALPVNPGGDYIVITSGSHGHVISGDPGPDDYPRARFYEHHSIYCKVTGASERRRRREGRAEYHRTLKRKMQPPSAPDFVPDDLDVEVRHDD